MIQVSLPDVDDSGEFNPRPCKILERKLIKKENMPVVMVLVQWTQENEDGATWEKWDKLKKTYPEFTADS